MHYKILFMTLLVSPHLLFSKEITHKVSAGESLMTISLKHFGTHQCFKQIKKENPAVLKNINQLEVGMILKIPPQATCKKIGAYYKSKKIKKIEKIKIVKKIEKVKIVKKVEKKKKVTPQPVIKRRLLKSRRIPTTYYTIQVASYKSMDEVKKALPDAKEFGYKVNIQKALINYVTWFRVHVGQFKKSIEWKKLFE